MNGDVGVLAFAVVERAWLVTMAAVLLAGLVLWIVGER